MEYLPDVYWVNYPPEEFAKAAASVIGDVTNDQFLGYRRTLEARSYLYYYGINPSGIHATSQILRGGAEGELALIRINHARSLVNTLVNLITASKLVWVPKGINTDYDAVLQCELTSSLLEYYWQELGVSELVNKVLEQTIVFGDSFIHAEWDEDMGEDFAASDELGQVKTGDVKFTAIDTWDVIRDPTKKSYDELNWIIVRRRKNKYDMAAKYPEAREAIMKAVSDITLSTRDLRALEARDDVDIYYFYHKKTPAVPEGKEVVFTASGDIITQPTPLKLGYFPVIRWSTSEFNSTPYAYTPFFDVLGIQELMDSLNTTVASNQSTLGTQLIAVEDGSAISPFDVAGGMKLLQYPPGSQPPKAIDLLHTAPEIFNYLGSLQKQQELLMGLNSVVRGEPQSGEQSGSALALLSTQALQQSSVIQGHHVRAVEMLGNVLLDLIRQNLSLPRTVALIGKENAFLVPDSKFSGTSFDRIKKVQVQIGNPLQQTASGRLEIASNLLQMGIVKTPEQYLQVMDTGRLDPLTHSLKRELDLIKSENEQLSQGINPPVLILDDHLLHAREHRAVLANPQARENPVMRDAVLQHIAEHEKEYYTAPPATLLLVGQQPPSLPPTGGSQPGGPSPSEVTAPPGNPDAGSLPPPAELPTNPQTGEQVQPPVPPVP